MHKDFELFENTTDQLERWFHKLATAVAQPKKVPFRDSYVYRYTEQTAQQAIIQKLARLVTTLRASHILLLRGYVQELGTLQRIMGDLEEDITFLSLGLMKEWTDRHTQFLADFYQEEFDDEENPANSTQKRAMVPRDKIRAFNARLMEGGDPSGITKATRSLNKTYSGYVHAASPQIMDMYGGDPPIFHLKGMLGTYRATEHLYDIWNYYYRTIITFGFAAHALGNLAVGNAAVAYEAKFQNLSGRLS